MKNRWTTAASASVLVIAAAVFALMPARRPSGGGPVSAGSTLPDDARRDEVDAVAADRALHEYFAAAQAKACDRVIAVSAKAMTSDECAESLDELERHGTQLLDVAKWSRDGRDASAMLASTRVTMDGRERLLVLRVEHKDGAWKVRL